MSTFYITAEEHRNRRFGDIQREGLANVTQRRDDVVYPVEHVTCDDQSGEWFTHLKGMGEPVKLEANEVLVVEWTLEPLIEQARLVVIEYGNGRNYITDRIRINYDADHVYVGLPIPSIVDGEKDDYTPVAIILRESRSNQVETFRYGKWVAHLQSLAVLAQENKALREREAAEREAQERRRKFMPIDDEALFAAVHLCAEDVYTRLGREDFNILHNAQTAWVADTNRPEMSYEGVLEHAGYRPTKDLHTEYIPAQWKRLVDLGVLDCENDEQNNVHYCITELGRDVLKIEAEVVQS